MQEPRKSILVEETRHFSAGAAKRVLSKAVVKWNSQRVANLQLFCEMKRENISRSVTDEVDI